ncbi:MAG: site-specific integrase [Bacteriovoracaceae bacterium]|nr:site-specific integrase [Bacteriovoracaceae bacterium]
MAITSKTIDGKVFFDIYVQARGKTDSSLRIQRRASKIENIVEAKRLEKKLYKTVYEEIAKIEGRGLKWIDIIERWSTSAKLGHLGDKYSKPHQFNDHVNRLKRYTSEWLFIQASELTKGDGRKVLAKAEEQGLAQATIRNIKGSINTVYKWGIEEKLIIGVNTTPVERLDIRRKSEKVPKILSLDEIKTLLYEAKRAENPWYRIWSFALYTGMRSGELMGLQWRDIDFEKSIIRVSQSYKRSHQILKCTKSGYWRTVPISKELLGILNDLKTSKPIKDDDFVLPRLYSWTNGEAGKVLREFLKSIGIDRPINFHSLRACFATHMLASGVDQATVMKIGGWQDLKTFQIYVRFAGIEVTGATDVLEVFSPSTDKFKNNVIDFERYQN